MRKDSGLTLVELLVLVVVLAVLATSVAPSFGRLVAAQRAITETNSLLTAIHLARSEAIRRGQRVTLCPARVGTTHCTGDVDYDAGWIVVEGPAPLAGLESTGEVITVGGPMRDMTALGNGSMKRYVSFLPNGQSRQISGALQMGRITLCNPPVGREIIVSRTGRPRVVTITCEG